jgi:hypothetical protein
MRKPTALLVPMRKELKNEINWSEDRMKSDNGVDRLDKESSLSRDVSDTNSGDALSV